MYDHARRSQARRLCAGCAVVDVCLWSTMAAEANDYRYGIAGGLGAMQRRHLAAQLSPGEVDVRLAEAQAMWRSTDPSASEPEVLPPPATWRPPEPAYRRRRRCRGCKAPIRQPRAGRPRLWCSRACRRRANYDRTAGAASARQRWAELPEEEKDRRRAGMRARWASLSPAQRAQVAARKRQWRHQRQAARAAS